MGNKTGYISEFSITYHKINTIIASGVNIAGTRYQCSQKGCQCSFKDVIISPSYINCIDMILNAISYILGFNPFK